MYKCKSIIKTFLTIFVFIFIFLFYNSSAHASTYYVDNVLGLDANDGLSTSSAWKTLSKATTIASAGDTVNVINNGSTNPFRERLAPARSGTSGNLIKFIGTGGSPILLGTVDYSSSATWSWHLSSHGTNEYYMTNSSNGDPGISAILPRLLATSTSSAWSSTGVDSLTNRSTGTLGSLSAGQWNWGNNDSLGFNTIYYRLASDEVDINSTHIEGGEDSNSRKNPILIAWQYIDIENFKVRYSNHHGILGQTLSNHLIFDNVDSSYTGRSGISPGAFTDITIKNSRFDHNGMISTVRADYTGIQLSGTTNCTITNNVVSNGNNDSGINVKASSNSNYIANNVVFNNAQHGIDVSTSSLNNTLYNNTLYNNTEQGINVESSSTGNVIKNNIMANNQAYQLSIFDSGSTTGLVLDYNLYHFSNASTSTIRFAGSFYSINTFATYKSDKSQDANSITGDPLFLNSSGLLNTASDYKLSSSSPAIDTGVSVSISSDYMGTAIPQGSLPDIGAYEYIFPTSSSTSIISSSVSSNSDSTRSENCLQGYKLCISAGPNLSIKTNFISDTEGGNKAVAYISKVTHHDDINLTINKVSEATLKSRNIKLPNTQNLNNIGDIYLFEALSAFNGCPIYEFDNPATVMLSYNKQKLNGISEKALKIARYDIKSGKWVVLQNNNVLNSENDSIANTTKNFSYFAVVIPNSSSVLGEKIKQEQIKDVSPKVDLQTPAPTQTPSPKTVPETKRCFWFICW